MYAIVMLREPELSVLLCLFLCGRILVNPMYRPLSFLPSKQSETPIFDREVEREPLTRSNLLLCSLLDELGSDEGESAQGVDRCWLGSVPNGVGMSSISRE